jgi:glycosyltransferase involved in cell wall biosynthesis
MKVALVEPYYGGSHKAWTDGYANRSNHEVVLLTHEARFWKWRMHGGFLTLAEQLAELAKDGWHPDVILASSMMDVAAFAGAIRHTAAAVPIATYFHESQFTYPLSPADKVDFTYQMKNWGSAAVSDLVIFNSEYHRSVFAAEASSFLNAFPDNKHVDMVDRVIADAVVLPVGIDLAPFTGDPIRSDEPPLLLWNQRWEHDKGPEELKAVVAVLLGNDVEFRMAMCGEVFVSVPPTFAEITEMLGDRLIHEGHAERSLYESMLRQSSVVLSTADQEFFGIGVIEAIAAGAYPVLPNRLVYPERIAALQYDPTQILFDSPEQAADLIERHLLNPPSEDLRSATSQYDWSSVANRYDESLVNLLS